MPKWLRTDGWLAGGVGGVVAVPLAIVLHELGHLRGIRPHSDSPTRSFAMPPPVGPIPGSGLRSFRAGDMVAAAALAEP